MTDVRAGQIVAAVRRHLGLRQRDVAALARVDQKVVSLIERGLLERVSVVRFRNVCRALGIHPALELRWEGGRAEQLIDRGHAAIVDVVVGFLGAAGWEVIPEFSFNWYGERGSVDILAWHPVRRVLLIIEVKTRLLDLQALLMSMSRKIRVVPGLVARERGWNRASLGRMLVVAEGHANRAVVANHRATFDASFPARSVETKRWLAAPSGDFAGVWFLPVRRASPDVASSSRRVRASHTRAESGRSAAEAGVA